MIITRANIYTNDTTITNVPYIYGESDFNRAVYVLTFRVLKSTSKRK